MAGAPSKGLNPACGSVSPKGTKKAIIRAQASGKRPEARTWSNREHLLIGLLSEDSSAAHRLLQEAGVVVGDLTRHLDTILTPGPGRDGTDLRLDSAAKKAIDLALSEARRQRRQFIGTEHLILGILAVDSGATGITFRHFGLNLQKGRYLADSVETFFPTVPLVVESSGAVATRQQEKQPDAPATATLRKERFSSGRADSAGSPALPAVAARLRIASRRRYILEESATCR